jgi:hypothetical protein
VPEAIAGTLKVTLKFPLVSGLAVVCNTLLKLTLTLDGYAKPLPVTCNEFPVVPVVLFKVILGTTVNAVMAVAAFADIVCAPATADGITIAVFQVVAVAAGKYANCIVSKLTVTVSVNAQVPETVTVVPGEPDEVLNVMVVPIAACTGVKTNIQANNSRINNTPANFKILRIISGPPLSVSIVFIHRIYVN